MEKNITIEEIEKLAKLSKLQFSDDEKQTLIGEVDGIVKLLNGCDDVKIIDIQDKHAQGLCSLRSDEEKESMDVSDIFVNSNNCRNGYFVVPKVVE